MTTNILVAGHSVATVELLRDAVDQLDYQLIPAPSMSLALYLAHKNLPELIICCSRLTDGDPITFLRELQTDDELRPIPFMVLTEAKLEAQERKQFMSSGAALVLDEKISPDELLSTIEPYIAARLALKEERVIETPE